MNVLGTPIQPATDDARARTCLLSDLHLGSDTAAAEAALDRLLAAARERAADTRVLILGDLFDVWVSGGQAERDPWRRPVELLRDTAAAGVSITLLHGNRDFMLDAGFARRTGCRVVPGGVSLRLGQRPALALHGDELCQRDLDYQRAKRRLRHPLTRGFLRALPTGLALRLGGHARKQSMAVIERQPDRTRFDPTRAAVEAAFATGAELLVFGHIHRTARGRFVTADGVEREYCVLPAFDEAGVHLRHEGEQLAFFTPDGNVLSDPAERAFG